MKVYLVTFQCESGRCGYESDTHAFTSDEKRAEFVLDNVRSRWPNGLLYDDNGVEIEEPETFADLLDVLPFFEEHYEESINFADVEVK